MFSRIALKTLSSNANILQQRVNHTLLEQSNENEPSFLRWQDDDEPFNSSDWEVVSEEHSNIGNQNHNTKSNKENIKHTIENGHIR